jgi:ribosome-associated toxin RatA of RatAB toxin-antitoxin module
MMSGVATAACAARGVDMHEVRRTALVPFSSERIFDLIEAAEHYPAFLPWCAGATVLARDETVVSARIGVDYHGVRFHFVTRNPKRRPEFMAVRLEQGPFRHFEGDWHLTQLSAEACKIEFSLRYEFGSVAIAKLAGPVFGKIADTLVDAFVDRAEHVYGAIRPNLDEGKLTQPSSDRKESS